MPNTLRAFFLLAIAVFLAACGKDPILADMEAFDAVGKAAFGDMQADVTEFNRKAAAAKTVEEKLAVLKPLIEKLDTSTKKLAGFEAKTPEVRKISEMLVKGLQLATEGAKEIEPAVANTDQAKLNTAMSKMAEGQRTMQEGLREFQKLAKEKGFKASK
jgi:hypothetical protein